MEKRAWIAATLNLFTGVGGHFYQRKPYLAALFIILMLVVPMIAMWIYLAVISSFAPAQPPDFQNIQRVSTLTLVGIFVISALVVLFSSRRDDEPAGVRVAAAVLGVLIGGGAAVIQIWGLAKAESIDHQSATAKTLHEMPENVPPEEGRRFALSMSGDYVHPDTDLMEGGESFLTGRLSFEGQPLENARVRLYANYGEFTPWVQTDTDGRFHVPAKIGNFTVDAVDVVADSVEEAGAVNVITGYEDPLGEDRYGQWDTQSAIGYFVQVLRSGPERSIDLELHRALSPQQLDFSGVSADALADQQLAWSKAPGSSRHLVVIKSVTPRGDETRTNVLVYRVLDAPVLPLDEYLEKGEAPQTLTVELYAFDDEGRLKNYSDTENDQVLQLPEGFTIRDEYLSPCEQQAMAGE